MVDLVIDDNESVRFVIPQNVQKSRISIDKVFSAVF